MEDDRFEAILDSLPERAPSSRLEPHAQLIDQLRRLGRTYREIERILTEKCGIQAPRSTINDFVRRRKRPKRYPRNWQFSHRDFENQPATTHPEKAMEVHLKSPQTDADAHRKIAALEERPVTISKTTDLFHYDPNEPLKLTPKSEQKDRQE